MNKGSNTPVAINEQRNRKTSEAMEARITKFKEDLEQTLWAVSPVYEKILQTSTAPRKQEDWAFK